MCVWLYFVGRILQNGLTACWPTREPPALNDHFHLFILIGYGMRDVLEALPIQAHIHYEVTVCCPGSRSCWQNFFHDAIIANVCSEDISIELHRDVAHGEPNYPVAFVFGLKPEKRFGIVTRPAFWLDTPRVVGRPTWWNFTCKITDMGGLQSLRTPRMTLPMSWS